MKHSDRKVKILEPDWDEFRKIKLPVVCCIRLNSFVNHAVVACEMDADRVRIADPLTGKRWWSHEKFRERFLGEVISISRDGESP